MESRKDQLHVETLLLRLLIHSITYYVFRRIAQTAIRAKFLFHILLCLHWNSKKP